MDDHLTGPVEGAWAAWTPEDGLDGVTAEDVLALLSPEARAEVEARLRGEEPAPPQLHFPGLPEFVDYLATLYRREVVNTNARNWCLEWWRHPEAVARLDALWRAWETLRRDPATGMSIWWRDHADPHMSALMSDTGPLAGCTPKLGHAKKPLPPLPLTPPPDDWWAAGDADPGPSAVQGAA